MKPFGKGFIMGIISAVILLVLIPFFAEGMSPTMVILKMIGKPYKIALFAEIILVSGVIGGLSFQFFAWIGRKNKQNEEQAK
uniref:hypothetical protein n=1 Tax=Alloprevotella sp. TaxID=1872471 RepID=UPI003FEEE65E